MALTIFILRLAVCILAFPLYLLDFLGLWNWICKQWFPYFLARFTVMYNKQMESKKQELFSNLREFMGPSGKLSLLELGCGTGANFKFYPSGCQVTCVDPNPNFEKFLIKCIAQADTCSLSPSDGCRGEHAPGGHRLHGCGGLHPGALLREEPGADPPGRVQSAEAGEC